MKLREIPVEQRANAITTSEQAQALRTGLSLDAANHMIENVVATYALPMGVAENFVINGRDVLVPMVVEESSVVAACSYAAKLARSGGGFSASSTAPIMIGQVQLLDVADLAQASQNILAAKDELLDWLNTKNASTISKHARAIDLETRIVQSPVTDAFIVAHVLYDCGDAMGANLINTACEAIAPKLEALSDGRAHLKILSNLNDRRLARAQCTITQSALGDAQLIDGIVAASVFAESDPYRATTHNKGVMNGIDAVVVATGNDWRAVEAAAHAYAARDGRYTSMTRWRKNATGDLVGEIELPMAVGIVGGATRVHPSAQAALQIMGVTSARELAEVIVSVGLAQNLAAIRALASEGIQHGHMALHARQIAIAAGATHAQIERVAEQLIAEKNVRLERAKEIVKNA